MTWLFDLLKLHRINIIIGVVILLLLFSCKTLYDSNKKLKTELIQKESIIKQTLKKNEDLRKIQLKQQKSREKNEKDIRNRNYFDNN